VGEGARAGGKEAGLEGEVDFRLGADELGVVRLQLSRLAEDPLVESDRPGEIRDVEEMWTADGMMTSISIDRETLMSRAIFRPLSRARLPGPRSQLSLRA
jgi:hypothetical protein